MGTATNLYFKLGALEPTNQVKSTEEASLDALARLNRFANWAEYSAFLAKSGAASAT